MQCKRVPNVPSFAALVLARFRPSFESEERQKVGLGGREWVPALSARCSLVQRATGVTGKQMRMLRLSQEQQTGRPSS